MTDRPAIKPLEWEYRHIPHRTYPQWKAETIVGRYVVVDTAKTVEWYLDGKTQVHDTSSVEAAKAAAQSDFESRIRSCLLDKPEAVEGERLESARAEQWRLRREAEAGRDTAKAVAHSFRNERDALRAALSDIIEGWDFWEVNHHDREPPRDAIRRARAALSTPADTDASQSELDRLRRELEEARGEAAMLQDIIDSRPAINAGLPETYIRWSQSIYSGDAIRAALRAGEEGR